MTLQLSEQELAATVTLSLKINKTEMYYKFRTYIKYITHTRFALPKLINLRDALDIQGYSK